MRRRKPGVDREGRDLDREGHEHGNQRQHGREAAQRRAFDPDAHVEGARSEVKPDDRQQKRQRAQKRVEKEHECGPLPLFIAPACDHEVHADQRDLEEDVEEQAVKRHERAERGGFQHQHQHHVGGRAFADPRRIQRRQKKQKRGQQHQRQAQPVHAQPVGRANGRDPGDFLDLGEVSGHDAARPDHQCDQEHGPRGGDGHRMCRSRGPVGQRHERETGKDGQEGGNGQKRHERDPQK